MSSVPTHPDDAIPCVIFGAKSSPDPRESVPAQWSAIRAAIAGAGSRFEYVPPFGDVKKSAYSGNRGEGLAAAKEAALQAAASFGEAELWVQHSDRLARGDGIAADHLAEVWFDLRRSGVRIRSVEDDSNLDDAIRVVLIGERNHEDSKRKSAATRSGKRRRFEAGKAVGGPVHDGYRVMPRMTEDGAPHAGSDGRVVLDRVPCPQRRSIIERIFELAETGMTDGEIQRRLNAEGLRTRPSSEHPEGVPWTTCRIKDTLENPFYTGKVRAYGEVRNAEHEPLISLERWEQVQAGRKRLDPGVVQARKGGRRSAEPYLLRGLAFCLKCGSTMFTRRQAAGRVYVCRHRRQGTGLCDAPPVIAEAVEHALLEHLDDFVPHLDQWIAARMSDRSVEHDRHRVVVVAQEARLHELKALMAAYRRQWRLHAEAGEDRLAALALREVEAAQAALDEQASVVADAAARLEEWEADPASTNLALDFYNQVRSLLVEAVGAEQEVDALRARLKTLLGGVWMGATPAGEIGARVTLADALVPAEVRFLSDGAKRLPDWTWDYSKGTVWTPDPGAELPRRSARHTGRHSFV